MKKLLVIALLLTSFMFKAQKGAKFPVIEGSLLNDKAIKLPVNNGKFTVVAIAYHRAAEDALKEWLNPLYNLFIVKEKGTANYDMAEVYDVNFVFVPMISGFKKIRDDFKAGTDKAFWPYIMDTEKSDVKLLQKELNAPDNKIPYFYILDKDGKIVTMQSGDFTEEKMEALEDAVSK